MVAIRTLAEPQPRAGRHIAAVLWDDRPDVELRRYEPADAPAVLALLHASRGSTPSVHDRAFFAWKHAQSPFGPSPAWVAEVDGKVVGFRTFMRWQFDHEGGPVEAVRAVDTATHPDHQGRGIFTRLTLHALRELAAEGVAFVFNTPNGKSRPGYLKMGWKPVATLPVLARPRTPIALTRLLAARVSAEKWSLPTAAGVPAAEVFADHRAVGDLLASMPSTPGLRTHRTPEFFAWRYSFRPLAYRAVLAGDSIADGLVVFRLRRRGPVVEAAVCDVLLPAARAKEQSHLLRQVLHRSGADVAVRVGTPEVDSRRALPGVGPTLVWRNVCERWMPPPQTWNLTLGDVEIF